MKRFCLLTAAFCVVLVATLAVAAAAAPQGELEIFSWWAGDEGPALEALIALYEAKYPEVTVINATVTGGAGVHAKAVLKTRMLGGDPPDSFQVHAGQELIGTWVVAQRMEDLTWLFQEEGWFEVFPEDLLALISTDEGIWSVPVNIHRSNVMYYIPENLKKWGVEPPKTWDEFLAIAPSLQEQGVIPLSLGENWTAIHLWESVALSYLGPDKYDDLWEGKLSWTSPEVVGVWELFGRILEYTNPDAPSLSWQQATDMVVAGQAAFNIMGDWASGYMSVTLGVKPEEGYGWAPSPGTEGVFMALSDSFGLPVGCPNRENTIAWLKTIGSKEGQDTFNPLKGSISPRIDSDLSKYDVYLQSAARDYQSNRIVGSLAHGTVANERFMNDFATVMDIFLANKDPQAAAYAAQAVAIQSGLVK
ncbi:MAG TPA: ABC transporter substrate-binding protein [Limnochordia bacterium]|jgi:glucose/mannose transport system substrate-binding protein|nr:carbohydrate ABC transporter substrate-binding protein [Bacillota bacterium]HOM00634.1 ABC transporter substrate-binding protein [Limnochordia bacterium]HOQ72963.1 ABC transporter substrate-binding protein [Limnochordia bacterium]HPP72278.1 ABC transporter substrate-binding protein [Limnochordia bacterium]HPU64905.1 ABC transporter substrate-binding protein [Limnochordia bacterium]